MNGVLVVGSRRQPLMPTSPVRARKLLDKGRAAVLRRFPFTIILKDLKAGEVQHVRLKIDPGSRETGIALVNEANRKVIFAMVLVHRSRQISEDLLSRRAIRRGRRNRNTRYRKPGLPNRQKANGWLAPSLLHRVLTTLTWVNRLRQLSPIFAISQELVRFDLQKIENPEIAGIEYQRGTLFGYEVKGYLLAKFNHACAYCDAKDMPLEIEHVVARTNGGTDRVSNLTIACRPCNEKKGSRDVKEFLTHDPARLARVLAQMKHPLKDAAAVNSTRWILYRKLQGTGLPIELGSGGRTKFNRSNQGLSKEHWIDAACVGKSGERVIVPPGILPLQAQATGHGNRQMCGTDKFGFPNRHRTRQKIFFGFQTGDGVKAMVLKGKRAGSHAGKVLVRATGFFDIRTANGRSAGISFRHIRTTQRKDGYTYA